MKKIKQHLNQYALVAAALGFAFGHTASDFIHSLVEGAIMPAISLIFQVDDWQNHTFLIGSYSLLWGEIVKNGIRFFIVATSVIYILKWLDESHKVQ